MEEQTTLKKPKYDMSRFTVGGTQITPEYENYVNLTAKLINRSYIATAKLVEFWSIGKIIERYMLCTKHVGDMPGDVKWFWLRKKDVIFMEQELARLVPPGTKKKDQYYQQVKREVRKKFEI